MPNKLPKLNNDQIAELVTGSVRPDGTLPYPIFFAISKAEVLTSIEVVTIRRNKINEELEALLTLRDNPEDIWYGKLHSPGVMLRVNDTKIASDTNLFIGAFSRIEEEIGSEFTLTPDLVKMDMRDGLRGEQLYFLYVSEINDAKPYNGEFYPVNALPENTIDFHVDMIREAAKFFEEHVLVKSGVKVELG